MGNCVTMEMHGNSNSDFSHSSKMCARTGVVEINLGHINFKSNKGKPINIAYYLE